MCGFLAAKIEKHQLPQVLSEFQKLKHRGPDNTQAVLTGDNMLLAFHRLAIMGLSDNSNQPISCERDRHLLLCNGEIYNYEKIFDQYPEYNRKTKSDCESILPLWQRLPLSELSLELEGEFAFVIYDQTNDSLVAARDPLGIRPLFYGTLKSNQEIVFASEAKALIHICDRVTPFPPGHYYQDGEFHKYSQLDSQRADHSNTLDSICQGIHDRLVEAVQKRMIADRPIGMLLSGGLDSSLVCAIAAKNSDFAITTFAVGIEDNPIDTHYARIVANYLGTNHHEFLFTQEDVFESLERVIYHLESFDITTVRASIGMYLLCEYIARKTDIKVILTGEVSDEIFGYKYTDYAPSPEAFQKESEKRIRELHLYDALRADRCISAHSLEARVPFSDYSFVKYVMNTSPAHKINSYGHGKFLLRKAFTKGEYLPESILFREKAAFSDAVGHSMVDYLKAYAEQKYTDQELLDSHFTFPHCPPPTKEALLYREIFEKHFPGQGALIKDFWMPNKEWKNCNVNDPSARALPNYGKSGSVDKVLIEEEDICLTVNR